MEEWRAVVGFEGLYEVSDLGRVRSLDRVVESPGSRRGYPKRLRGRLLRPQRHSGGYRQISICGQIRLIHALVMEAFEGPCPPSLEVCHGDGDKTNNRFENLRYDTREANCEDRRKHGFCIQGERNHRAKLTAGEVLEIRRLKGTGTQEDIAAGFCVTGRAVGKIHRGERWRHV